MALDFHIASSNNEAPYQQASASFELQPHEIIFYRGEFPTGKYPLFSRLKDYYKDAKYGPEEIGKLILELNEIIKLFQANSQVEDQLKSIMSACGEALNKKMGVWVYCD